MLDKIKQFFELKSKMSQLKKELEVVKLEVASSDGKIKVVITGDQRIESLEIQDELFDVCNKDVLQRNLRNCINDAIKKSQEEAAGRMKALTAFDAPL